MQQLVQLQKERNSDCCFHYDTHRGGEEIIIKMKFTSPATTVKAIDDSKAKTTDKQKKGGKKLMGTKFLAVSTSVCRCQSHMALENTIPVIKVMDEFFVRARKSKESRN